MQTAEIKDFFKREFKVNSYHTDLKGKLSIPSIFLFFQEIAWEHASMYGFGYDDLKDHNSFWVLSRIHLQVDILPSWTDDFTLSTWPSGTEGPFALRDFIISNSAGEQVIRATSSWLIVDAQTRRPKRPDAFKDRMPICDTIRATNCNAPKIDTPEGETIHEIQHTVGVCDIDVNGHINNTKYIEWAINSFGEEEYKEVSIKQVDVNFVSEGFCNDCCRHTTERIDANTRRTSITRKHDGKVLAVVRVITEP
ncbi:MAG: thioesterase [Tenuifilaceae bacterium]|jgi:acyl-ACP thioesterase|nr:thioesterase [Tenuifilaceae bacterium]